MILKSLAIIFLKKVAGLKNETQPEKNYRRWHKHAVKAVQQSTMSGDDVARIFHIFSAFYERFGQVAESPENNDDFGKNEPLKQVQFRNEKWKNKSWNECKNGSANKPLPGLFGWNAFKKFVFAQ